MPRGEKNIMTERAAHILLNGAVIVALAGLLFAASTLWRLHQQFEVGETALHQGDFTGAVAGYESAIRMYVPFDPAVERAAQQLWSLGEQNERQGNTARALIAYRSLRSSFYAVHWLKTPGKGWIARCDQKISALVPLLREQ
jgi:tetratricopeptide (TPR) repeat protein